MRIHKLKIERRYYEAVNSGDKLCEIRYNDRDYQKGDKIAFLGDNKTYEVTHVLHYPEGLRDGWVVLSIKKT